MDGQSAMVNRTLTEFLGPIIKKNLKSWAECLPFIEFAYNCVLYSATKHSPLEIIYDFNPLILLDLLPFPIGESINLDSEKNSELVKSIMKRSRNISTKITTL